MADANDRAMKFTLSKHCKSVLLALAAATLTLLAGCNGDGGTAATSTTTGTTTTTAPSVQNVQAITVDLGPVGNDVNVPFISITLCATGTSNCQTIDHISVDTGSSGLRVISSVLTPALASALGQQRDASGRAIAECTQFADGYVWGPVKLADLSIAGEQAKSLPIQVIGDSAFPNVPSDCSNTGAAENTVAIFGANGIIGVGPFQADCGSFCATTLVPGAYYACPSSVCVNALAPVASQVQNPVGLFATDNNGVVIQLPSVPAAGQAVVTGSLIFGIGTQSNNSVTGATVLPVDATTGYLSAVFNGQTYSDSFIDSGSSAYFLPSGFAAACPGNFFPYFCPASPLGFTASLRAANGTSSSSSATVVFSIANAQTLTTNAPNFAAFNNLGAENADAASFDFGLPFFYGRTVFTAIENKSTPVGNGPYVAF